MWSQVQRTVFEAFSYSPLLSFGGILLGFGWVGHLIVTQYLLEKQIRGTLSKTTFTLTFTCSLALLAMYLY